MIVPDGSDNDDKKSAPDYTGAIKIATAIVIGILTIVGFGWEDLIGKSHNTSISSKKTADVKKNSDEYEDVYLDEEISQESLNQKDFSGAEEGS